MKNKKISSILFLVVCLITLTNAAMISIEIEDSFTFGETIFFDYAISFNINQNISYLANIYCLKLSINLIVRLIKSTKFVEVKKSRVKTWHFVYRNLH